MPSDFVVSLDMAIIIPSQKSKSITFFGDASSKGAAHVVLGGFAVPNQRIHEIENHVATLREQAGISEFHWSEYKGGSTRAAYEELVRYAFRLVADGHASLLILISPFKGYRHKAHNRGSLDMSVNRMYYQLLLHRPARLYGKSRTIHVRLDAGGDSSEICIMREELCAAAYNQHNAKPDCVKSVQAIPSESSGIIQMADVLLGGIAAKRNEVKHTSEKGPLASLILSESGHPGWHIDTSRNAKRLNVWNFKSKK